MPRSAHVERSRCLRWVLTAAAGLGAVLSLAACGTAELSLDLPRTDAAPAPDGAACHTDRDCEDGTRCDAAEGTCVECLTPDDCSDEELCTQGICVQCRTDADCTGEQRRCVGGRCGECGQDTDCEAGVCDPRELTCEGP